MNQQVKASDDDGAWRALTQHASESEFLSSWLSLQCRAITGCLSGWAWEAVGPGGALQLAAAHPASLPPPAETLALAMEAAQRRDGVIENAGEQSAWHLAYPLVTRGRVLAVVAVKVEALSMARLKPAMRQLQWGSGWYFAHASLRAAGSPVRPAQIALELFIHTLEAKTFPDAAMNFAVEAAQKLGLDRASIGIQKWRRIDVAAVSNAPLADQRMAVMRGIEAAMDEAVDQRAAIILPSRSSDEGVVTRANEALTQGAGQAAIATFPLTAGGETMGAVVFERAFPFTDEEIAICESIASLAGPILDEKRRNDRWILTRLALAVGGFAAMLVGARRPRLKLALAAAAAIAVAAIFVHPDYEIGAPAVIEAEAKRVVLVPFDAYLARAVARPGDIVKAGDVLGALDDTDLKLEKIGLTADREQRESELQAATAKYELAKVNVLRAEIDQIKAKLQLTELRLSRALLTAPIDGLVLTGDLSQSIGEPVKTGAPLFELAPIGSFRLVVNVDESDIADAKPGQQGRAVLAALPDKTFTFEVIRTAPVVGSQDGRNFYRVEARLTGSPAALRPGYEGRARINAGPRPLWWIATRRLMGWLRLQFWTWAP